MGWGWGAHNVNGLHIVYTVHFVNRGLILFFRFFRVVAYRQFTRMVHGILRDKRIPLPACAYHAIRSTFNLSKNEHFEGYEEIDL